MAGALHSHRSEYAAHATFLAVLYISAAFIHAPHPRRRSGTNF
jgi:hypothetical protein